MLQFLNKMRNEVREIGREINLKLHYYEFVTRDGLFIMSHTKCCQRKEKVVKIQSDSGITNNKPIFLVKTGLIGYKRLHFFLVKVDRNKQIMFVI